MDKVRKIWEYINMIRSLPAFFAYSVSLQKDVINKDLDEWIKNKQEGDYKSIFRRLNYAMVYFKSFRAIFYNRVTKDHYFLSKFIKGFYKPISDMRLSTFDIGGGLFVQHGYGVILDAKKIGECCWVNQFVTAGHAKSYSDSPRIGNNVKIGAGAIILGDITIGDNVVIGANATITKSVPANCTVVGSRCVIIKKDNQKVNIPL